jgi:hypothetical protein
LPYASAEDESHRFRLEREEDYAAVSQSLDKDLRSNNSVQVTLRKSVTWQTSAWPK